MWLCKQNPYQLLSFLHIIFTPVFWVFQIMHITVIYSYRLNNKRLYKSRLTKQSCFVLKKKNKNTQTCLLLKRINFLSVCSKYRLCTTRLYTSLHVKVDSRSQPAASWGKTEISRNKNLFFFQSCRGLLFLYFHQVM